MRGSSARRSPSSPSASADALSRGDELEALLLRETASKTNAWYTWRDELGQTVEYLVDLERAARLARAQPDSLHGQIQLAAMRASVQSVTEIVPWELLAALLNQDRKSTRLNSSHLGISYAVFCLT